MDNIQTILDEFDAVARPFEKMLELKVALQMHLRDKTTLEGLGMDIKNQKAVLDQEKENVATAKELRAEMAKELEDARVNRDMVINEADTYYAGKILDADNYFNERTAAGKTAHDQTVAQGDAMLARKRGEINNINKDLESAFLQLNEKNEQIKNLDRLLDERRAKMAEYDGLLDSAKAAVAALKTA